MFFEEKSSPKLLLRFCLIKNTLTAKNKSSDDSWILSLIIKYQNLTHPDLHLVFPVLLIKTIRDQLLMTLLLLIGGVRF